MPRLLTAAALVGVLLTTGSCASDDDPAADVADLPGVAVTDQVPYSDDPEQTYLQVTTDDGLSEDEVRSVVDGIKDHFDDSDVDPGSVQVVFDGFRSRIYPEHLGADHVDPDLERGLWLRADGRATGFGPGSQFRTVGLARSGTGALALAPAADVAQLALDLEAEVSTDGEVRRSYYVGSPDGSVRVQWTNYPDDLDREGLERFLRLQQRLPGTTGWYDDRGGAEPARVGVHVDPAALTVAEFLAQGEGLLADLDAAVVEVGWGPLRAESIADLRALERELRPDLDRLLATPGVVAVRSFGIEVADVATATAVRRLLPEESVSVVREPNDLIGFAPDPVVEVGPSWPARINRVRLQLASVPGLRQVRGVLALETDISPEALDRVMRLLVRGGISETGLPVVVGERPIPRTSELPVVGTLTEAGFQPADEPQPPVTAELVDRIAAAWDAARAAQR